jgi:predicted nucleic acid-binding protein
MGILVDTNVLLRRIQSDHPEHGIAVESVARLLAAQEAVYFTASEHFGILECGHASGRL